jgi:benzoyl-CoA reductase/2-hydroxyglutaryl-CoA dehydratase subunit BcrC/BadD/HgdB
MYEISINKPNKKAKIHKKGCPHIKKTCSYQQGTSNQIYIPDFTTLEDACNYIKKHFYNYKEIGCCKHCIKSEICPC